MTTHLKGKKTFFLPFNLGDNGAAGNPVNPNGPKTAYLWEQVFEREQWLEILGRYLVAERDKKKQIKSIIFPRYHQLDSTRKIRSAVLEEGPGQKYLIQHSAGSGKTKTTGRSNFRCGTSIVLRCTRTTASCVALKTNTDMNLNFRLHFDNRDQAKRRGSSKL